MSVFLLPVSCFEGPKAELRSVQVDLDTLVIPSGGTVEFLFTVDNPEYEFDLQKDVILCLSHGQFLASQDFFLLDVVKEPEPGLYRAVVVDTGRSDDYVSEVYLGVKLPEGHYRLSLPFLCIGEFAGPMGRARKTGLPLLFVNTQDAARVTSKEDYVKASVWLEEGGTPTEAVSCGIRGRGNTTWAWPKKPYALKFDSKVSFFGFPAHKRWVLLANFMDRTMMRNLVSMKVASMTSLAWTPRCRPVELVLNGVHQGNYLLIEQVKVDKNRINLSDGFLLESDFHYDNEIQWMDKHGSCVQMHDGIPFGIKHPDPEDISPADVQYVKDYISRAASAIYGADFSDPEKGYAAWIDVDSFIDYWIVFEVMGNHELGNPGSVYYHFERDGKIKAGPCWDFDWGILSYNTSPQARSGLINRSACWYARLFQDPAFAARVRERFNELLPQLRTIPDFIDETEKMFEVSATENFKMWNPAQDASMNGGRIINGDENMSFHDAVARLKSIYKERLTVIQNNL
ncbi:MAG: CotH kinase family protein [Bacteroidales bacterium]|nr:CotH kinase family protein [Bacteroidales bacterium]